MLRALTAAIIVFGISAGAAAAQTPALGFAPVSDPAPPRVATLGDPLAPTGRTPPPLNNRPSAWESTSAASVSPAPSDGVPPGNLPPPTGSYTGIHSTLPRPVSDPVSAPQPAPFALPPGAEASAERRETPLFENFSLFLGIDGSKEPVDLGINTNLGYRVGFNWGVPLLERAGVALQVGSAINYSQNSLRYLQFVDGTVDRYQSFTTVGLFQRADNGLRWGVVYDFRFDDSYDRTSTGQWRAQLGYAVTPESEFGVWATIRDHGDSASIGPFEFSVEPISQWNFYWRRIWPQEVVTRLWVGVASQHSRFNPLLPSEPSINHPFTFGGDVFVPLTQSLALFGEAHFITPNDTGTVTATFGIALYPGTARGTARSRFAPLLPVANNATFALDVR